MKKNNNMVSLVLMSIVTAAITISLNSCSDDLELKEATTSIVNNDQEMSVKQSEQTNDAMSVRMTNGMEAAVLSNFEGNSMGAALVRRLPAATASVNKGTQLILVSGDDVAQYYGSSMKRWAAVYLNGGNIAVENPTGEQLTSLANAMSEQLSAIREARLTADGDITIKARGNGAKRDCYEGELLKVRAQNVKNFAVTRSGVADLQNGVVADMVIFSTDGCYMYATTDEKRTTYMDEDGNISMQLNKGNTSALMISQDATEKLEAFGMRRAVFDVYCEGENGEKFIVEMQKAEQGAMNRMKENAKVLSEGELCLLGAAYALNGQKEVCQQLTGMSGRSGETYWFPRRVAKLLAHTYLEDNLAHDLAEETRQDLMSERYLSTASTALSLIAMGEYYKRNTQTSTWSSPCFANGVLLSPAAPTFTFSGTTRTPAMIIITVSSRLINLLFIG